jgi:uncharacterized membrane protein YgcG
VQDPEDSITRYVLDLQLSDDGTAHAVLDVDMDFGSTPNHGPYLTYLTKQQYDDDSDRIYRFSDIHVTSPTGAPADLDVSDEGPLLVLRIGDPDRGDITGVQSYRVTFTVEGWINSAEAMGLTEDELYLNVFTGFAVPIHEVTVRVVAPGDVVMTACFAGYATDDCTSAWATGPSAVYTQELVAAGEPMTVVAAFTAGTFGGVEPIIQERWSAARAFSASPLPLGVAVVVLALGSVLVVRRVRSAGRDEQYLGLTPGLVPLPGDAAGVGVSRGGPIAVQFLPPTDFHAGQLGTLLDEKADPQDVTATLIDLAVRGFLRIEVVEAPDNRGKGGDWRLVRLDKDPRALLPFERLLLDEVFHTSAAVELSALRTTFAASMAKVQAELYTDVTARGWFRGNPDSVRTRWAVAGALLTLLGIAVTVLLAKVTTFGLAGLAICAIGVVVIVLSRSAPARTADGTAVLVQARGFRTYLATAEASQLRFEEGQDLFSRYLPYAVAFGLTERWARVFADLAAQGRRLAEPSWYVGPGYGHGMFWADGGSFSNELTSFTAEAGEAISAPTPGSSGSSGSGGFSGGGVGGGGGGSW